MARVKEWYNLIRQHFPVASKSLATMISLASFAVVAYYILRNSQDLSQISWSLSYRALFTALLLYGLATILAVTTWGQMLEHYGADTRWLHNFQIYARANIARHLPTPAWFLAERVVQGQKVGISKTASSAAAVIEGALILISGILVMVVLSPLTLLMGSRTILLSFGVALAAALGLWALRAAVPRLATLLGEKGNVPDASALHVEDFLKWGFYYSIVWVLGGSTLFFLISAVHPLDVSHLLEVTTIWVTGGVVSHIAVILPGGLGLKELTMTALLMSVVPPEIALITPIAVRIWYLVGDIVLLGMGLAIVKRLPL